LQTLRASIKTHGLAVGILFAASLATYLAVFDPAVFADDWVRIRKFVFGQLPLVDWSSRRPFEEAFFKLVLGIFGLNFRVQLLVQVLILFLCAVVIYGLCRRAFPNQAFLALPAGLLFLLYPMDYMRLWFTRIYHWGIYLMVLVAFVLILEYALKGKWPALAGALALMALSLGAYDGQLGLICAAGLLPALLLPGVTRRHRLVLLLPFALGLLFSAWRLFIQPEALGVNDPYVLGSSFSPLVLADRVLSGYPLFLQAWVRPFQAVFPGITMIKMEVVLAGVVFCAGLLAAALPGGAERWVWSEKRKEALGLLAPLGVGLALIAFGFFPAVVLTRPNLDLATGSTRANQYAILGGALALAALLGLIATLAAWRRAQVVGMVYAALIPFFLLGVMQQSWIQSEAHAGWSKQQAFWRELFLSVPNLRDGAVLVVVEQTAYPGGPFQRMPLSVEWEVNNAVQVFYNNPSLGGTLYLPQFSSGGSRETRLDADGVRGYDLTFAPWDRLVVVLYTPSNGQIRLVENPEAELGLPFAPLGYAPRSLILDSPPEKTPYRSLLH
jgi:hypothetical protein